MLSTEVALTSFVAVEPLVEADLSGCVSLPHDSELGPLRFLKRCALAIATLSLRRNLAILLIRKLMKPACLTMGSDDPADNLRCRLSSQVRVDVAGMLSGSVVGIRRCVGWP